MIHIEQLGVSLRASSIRGLSLLLEPGEHCMLYGKEPAILSALAENNSRG